MLQSLTDRVYSLIYAPEPTLSEKAGHAVKVTAAVLAGGFATSACVYGVGVAVGQLGVVLAAKHLIRSSAALIRLGHHISWVGMKIFQAFGVPTYAVLYALPKWLLETAIPYLSTKTLQVTYEVARLGQNALSILNQHLAKAIVETFEAVHWLAKDVVYPLVYPLYQSAMQVACKAANALVDYAVQPLAQGIVRLASYTKDILSNAAGWAWDHVLLPVASSIAQVAREVIFPAMRAVGAFGRRVATAIVRLAHEVLSPVLTKAAEVSRQLARYTWKMISTTGRWLAENVISPSLKWLTQTVSVLWNNCSRAYRYLMHKWVVPAVNTLMQGVNAVAKWAMQMAVSLCSEITSLANRFWGVFSGAMMRRLSAVAHQIMQIAATVGSRISVLASRAWGGISASAQWATDHVLNPLMVRTAELISSVWVGLQASFQYIGREWVVPAQKVLWQAKDSCGAALQVLIKNVQEGVNGFIRLCGW